MILPQDCEMSPYAFPMTTKFLNDLSFKGWAASQHHANAVRTKTRALARQDTYLFTQLNVLRKSIEDGVY